MRYKGKGEHSVDQLESIIEIREESIHLLKIENQNIRIENKKLKEKFREADSKALERWETIRELKQEFSIANIIDILYFSLLN